MEGEGTTEGVGEEETIALEEVETSGEEEGEETLGVEEGAEAEVIQGVEEGEVISVAEGEEDFKEDIKKKIYQ